MDLQRLWRFLFKIFKCFLKPFQKFLIKILKQSFKNYFKKIMLSKNIFTCVHYFSL